MQVRPPRGAGLHPPLIVFEAAPAPANVIIDLDESLSGAKQGEGEETFAPPLIPELIVFETAPTPANVIIDLDGNPSGAKQGEGEETLTPPLIPEIVQINIENTRDSGADPTARGVTEGEVGDSDPPAPSSPEGSQPSTNILQNQL